MAGRRAGRLGKDFIAGLINAVVSVPDGLASAALVGVNPVFGLYTSIAGPAVGSSIVSAQLMQISTTAAASLAAGQAISAFPENQREPALFLLVLLAGLWLCVFALLRFGRLVRFVSHAVMTGFLIGVAVVLILDQLAQLLGVETEGGSELFQFIDLLGRLEQVQPGTVLVGVLALGLVAGLSRTPIAGISSLLALLIPTLLVVLLRWDDVPLVSDVSVIPRGFPPLAIPRLELLSVELVFSAAAVAVVIGVQGAGVSQTLDNPDGSEVSTSRDFLAQGMGNIASSLVSGIPAGGSVGQTALNVQVGAQSRWGGIFAGLWMLAIVLLVPGLVGFVPMAVLAALMIVAGVSAIDPAEARSIWSTGGAARWSILATFLATLVFSVPQAVGVGVLLSVVLYLVESASDVSVHTLVRQSDGSVVERPTPTRLRDNSVTVLEVYGSLFFAGARTLRDTLPDPAGAENPVVILRLRGRPRLGATLIEVLDDYADDLQEANGRLYLVGVSKEVARQLRETGKLEQKGVVHVISAGSVRGAATERAVDEAEEWLRWLEEQDGN